MLDRDESGLHATQLSIEGKALLDSPSLLLADIRDRDRLFGIFAQFRPEVVFHAAALKHLTLLEQNPAEGWKTNVVGTRNVLEASEAVGVPRFVNVSTDKAADPCSVLGYTKRLGERMTADVAARTGLAYASVRFGNVLGSRGSMLGTFQAQVEAGGPITVTDPDVTRYFMTVQESVALTIQAGALADPGQVLVLDMGEPVRIADVARRLAETAVPPVSIIYTGLRPGEKKREVLLGAGEQDERPRHPLISQVAVPPLSFEAARSVCVTAGTLSVSSTSLELACGWGTLAGQPALDAGEE
jgi:FlaA1/EpsC-like NDP-sugar epimerase